MESIGKKHPIKKSRTEDLSRQNQAQVNKVKRLFQNWLQESSGYDEESWPQLKRSLNENHSKLHKLFDE